MQSANKSLRVPLSTKHERLGAQKVNREKRLGRGKTNEERDATRTEGMGGTERRGGSEPRRWG